MHRNLLFPLVAALLLATTSCKLTSTLAPELAVRTTSLAQTTPSGPAPRAAITGEARHVEGSTGPGALYAMDVPAAWNGDLVVYVHGYNEESNTIELPKIDYLRDPLLQRGYAVVASSFSSNGYALKEGAQQTHQLRGLFVSQFGTPKRTYIIGQSLGGIIGLKLAETYPQHYAGAVLGCGVVGGTRREIAYIANVRVLFDCLYGTSVIPGSLLEVPDGVDFRTQVAPAIVAAIQKDPSGAVIIARLLNIPFNSPGELVETIVRAIGFQFNGAKDFLDRAHGHVFFDNRNEIYQAPGLPQAVIDGINARVARYDATPDAESFMKLNYEPQGNLQIPVVALHTERDPVVPVWHEGWYRRVATLAGGSDLLLQRTVPKFGHCTYDVSDLLNAFDSLVGWVGTGVRPVS